MTIHSEPWPTRIRRGSNRTCQAAPGLVGDVEAEGRGCASDSENRVEASRKDIHDAGWRYRPDQNVTLGSRPCVGVYLRVGAGLALRESESILPAGISGSGSSGDVSARQGDGASHLAVRSSSAACVRKLSAGGYSCEWRDARG